MTEAFSAITFEAQLTAGTWTNISADVLQKPNPRVSGMGISSNGFLDHLGDAGRMVFYMNNAASNSGGVLGYYTPGGPNVRTGWAAGIPVRLSFSYDGYTRYKFFGYIDREGIEVEPGIYGTRRVKVTASNWLQYAADYQPQVLPAKANYRTDNAVRDLIDNASRKPQAMYIPENGLITFPTMFDTSNTKTTILGEFNKLVSSDFSIISIAGDDTTGESLSVFNRTGTFGYQGRTTSTVHTKNSDAVDVLLMEDGFSILQEDGTSSILLEASQIVQFAPTDYQEMDVTYGKNFINRVEFQVFPRTTATSVEVLHTLDKYITIQAGETLTDIRYSYRDPNNSGVQISGVEMVAPVATTDYQMFANSDGTGTDRTADLVVVATYGANEVSFSLTNNNAAVSYVTKLQVRGKGVRTYQPVTKNYTDTTTASTYTNPVQVNCTYLSSLDDLLTFSGKVDTGVWGSGGFMQTYRNIRREINRISVMVNKSSLLMMSFMFLEPPMVILLTSETMTEGIAGNTDRYADVSYLLWGYDFEIISGKYVKWMPVLRNQQYT